MHLSDCCSESQIYFDVHYKHPVRKMLKNIFSKISVDNFFGAKYNKDIEYQF